MSEVKVDTISERTAASGVTIDGVLLKDSIVNTDNIAEKTAAAGVTIDGVLIKDSVLKIPGGSPGADKVLTSDASGNATWEEPAAGGLTAASQWRLTTQFTNDAEPIASNLEQADAPVGFGVLGSSMTQSSGIFTFPSTGYWYITFQHNFAGNTNVYEKETHCKIMTTTNNSTYAVAADGVQSSGQNNPNNVRGSASTSYIFDVTDTANCKVRFDILVSDSGTATLASTDYLRTGMTFLRLADT